MLDSQISGNNVEELKKTKQKLTNYLAQKQLVTRHPRHGTFNIDVVGFFRLTYRVFEELSYIPKDLLEDEGKSMVIRKIMEQHKEELKVFASSRKILAAWGTWRPPRSRM